MSRNQTRAGGSRKAEKYAVERRRSTDRSKRSQTRSTAPNWRVVTLKDETTGKLSHEIRFPVGDGTNGITTVGAEFSDEAVAKHMRGLTKASIPDLAKLLRSGPRTNIIVTDRPGWRFDDAGHPIAFVTPRGIIGPKRKRYRWRGEARTEAHAGTADGWLQVPKLAQESNFLAFGLMVAMAGPLLRYAQLTEDAIFHLAGQTSVGKTLVAKVAKSLYGAPEPLPDWAQFPRALEESAALANETVNILNSAEKVPIGKRAEKLNVIVHIVPERQPPARSAGVQERFPNRSWQCLSLSTGNHSGAEMAKSVGRSWDEQDQLRFIDIRVSSGGGGIFDLTSSRSEAAERSADLVRRLERLLDEEHGTFWRVWVPHLASLDLESRVPELVDRFVTKVSPANGFEERIARKFGVVYAAGRIAVVAKLLPWPVNFPLKVVLRLYRQARNDVTMKRRAEVGALQALLIASSDASLFPPLATTSTLKVDAYGRPFGVRGKIAGQDAIAVRTDALGAIFPAMSSDQLVERLQMSGALVQGHGGERTRQLNLRLKLARGTVRKPRFYVVSVPQLRSTLERT